MNLRSLLVVCIALAATVATAEAVSRHPDPSAAAAASRLAVGP